MKIPQVGATIPDRQQYHHLQSDQYQHHPDPPPDLSGDPQPGETDL